MPAALSALRSNTWQENNSWIPPHLLYIPAGLQNNQRELAFQLTRQVERAQHLAKNVLLVYGAPYIGLSLDRFKSQMLVQLNALKRQGPASHS